MKKLQFLFLSLMLVAATFAGKAQDEIFDNPDNHSYLGLRIGLDVSSPGDVKFNQFKMNVYDPGAGFHLGAIYNIPLWKNLYFEPGVGIYYNTMKSKLVVDFSQNEVTTTNRRFGFRIPFNFGYRFDFDPVSVSAFTGPEANIGLVGRERYPVRGDETTINIYQKNGSFNRVTLGWVFGVGVIYGNYVFEISGSVGMTDALSGPGSRMHDNLVAFTLGYNF